MAHPQISAFARLANGTDAANRVIAGQKTKLARTMHDIRYDPIHDELIVPNQFAQAILTFRGGADGEEAPIRIIQGPKTRLKRPDRMDVDPVHNEIFVPNSGEILVFSREAHGNVAPIRVIRGPSTQLSARPPNAIAVDPVNNLIIVPSIVEDDPYQSILIFNRTDQGDVAPRAIIRGSKTGIIQINQIQVYPPRGWIVATQPGPDDELLPEAVFVGIWSINDNGDVPPRWKIGGPNSTLKKPRGVALDPENKEIIVADMRLNAVLTYYFPE
ncbi:hypothetical protein MYX82_13210, partial [Acidobacteria bacterium AH-259-D05]|nr:hypothetical protein [Acidobacteria bacterium AH-259-D05]